MKLHENKTLFNQAVRFTAQELGILDIYVEKDYQMAYEYYLSACQKQNREGFYHLGRWFFYGIGQKEDKQKEVKSKENILLLYEILIFFFFF